MKELEAIYRKRKKQLIPLIFGFATFFVFFRIIQPQWTDVSDALELISTKKSTIEAKEKSLLLLNSLSQEKVDDDFSVVTKALPLQKDIVLIYDELNTVANITNVKLGGFSVRLGGVYDAQVKKNQSEREVNGVPFLNIFISISGSNENLRAFAQKMYESSPLVEIKEVDIGKNDARYDVYFFFKPIAIRPANADKIALEDLTAKEKQQLETLRSW